MNGLVELRETLDVPGLAENCWIGAYSVIFGIQLVALARPDRGRAGSAGALRPHAQDIRVRLGRVGPDRERDGLAHLVLAGSAVPGTCQVALGSVGVADREVRGQVAEERGLGIERAFLVLPGCDHLLFERHARLPLLFGVTYP